MPTYTFEAVTALQSEATWRSAGFERPEDAETWWFAGFHAADAQQWLAAARYVFRSEPDQKQGNHAALAALAQTFKVADFTPALMRTWRDAFQGVDLDLILHEARRWRAAGFQPEEAQKWRQWGLLTGPNDLEFAVLFANAGWNPYEAAALSLLSRDRESEHFDEVRRAWVELGSAHTLDYVKAGVSPQQAAMFDTLNMAPDILLLELRRRHEALPPLDPYLAMHLNEVFNRFFGSDPKKERPFYAEPLTEVHENGTGGPLTSTTVRPSSTAPAPAAVTVSSNGSGRAGASSGAAPVTAPLAPLGANGSAPGPSVQAPAGAGAPGSPSGPLSNGSSATTSAPALTPTSGGSLGQAPSPTPPLVPPAQGAPGAAVPAQPQSPFNLPVRVPGSTNIAAPPPLPTDGPATVVDLTDTAATGIDIRDGGVVVNGAPAEMEAPVNRHMAEAMTGELPVVRPGYVLPRKQLPDLP